MDRKLGFGSLFSNSFASFAPVTPRLFAYTTLLLAILAADANAEKARPPRAKNVGVDVMRGGSVQIPLRGYERNLNRIEYRIIGQPRYGRLSGLTQHNGPDRQGPGQVTYTHGNDDNSTTDTFAFEVIAKPGNLRGRGRVTIRIMDAAPILEVSPAVLDFGSLAVADPPSRATVELRNAGGGVLQGFLEPPAPFLLEDNGSFVLRRGESTRIPILFAPERPGDYLFRVQPVAGDPAVLALKGEALSPFFVEVANARFTLGPDGSRTATAIARNSSQQMQTINVILPAESPVEQIATLELAPDEATNVVLRIPPETKVGAPSFSVRFEGAGHSQVQQFEAPAVPASLVVVSEPDFGEVRPGTIANADLVLRNDGGTQAEAKLLDHESIRPANGATTMIIPPGEEKTVPLKLKLKKDQPLPESFTLSFQNSDVVVPIKARAPASTSPTPTPAPSPTPPPERRLTLNEEVEYVAPPRGPTLRWHEPTRGVDLELEHRPGGSGSWQRYQKPAAHEGILEWFKNLVRKIEILLTTEIERPDIENMGAGARTWRTVPIAESSAAEDTWRLTVSRDGSAATPATDVFRIQGNQLVAVQDSPTPDPTPRSTPVAKTDTPSTTVRESPVWTPETKIASAGTKADRHSALLQVAFPSELRIQSFRLEQGSMVSEINPKTGIPRAPRFEVIPSPEASVESLGTGEGEAEGKKFTVCLARIGNLPAGTRTYWRLVPSGPQGEMPPTTVLLVDTQPHPPFPWNTVLLVSLFVLLAGVLYLRWRINRVPR
jgi:hypothetical protein